MSLSEKAASGIGKARVFATTNRGHNPEEYAEMALSKILTISDHAAPVVRAQANAFKENLRSVLIYYLTEAAKAERSGD